VAFVEDRSVFFSLDGPGNVAGILNGTFPLQGAYFGEYVSPYGVVEANASALVCNEDDIPYVEHGDRLVIGTKHYLVVNIQRDGTGVVRLVLNKA
jgi:hypothetical protein